MLKQISFIDFSVSAKSESSRVIPRFVQSVLNSFPMTLCSTVHTESRQRLGLDIKK